MTQTIAFLGIGLMGTLQAKRLLDHGFQVTVWNRSRAKAEVLEQFGAIVFDSAAEAVSNADIIISMLENGQIVGDVLFAQDVANVLKPGAVVIDMSSIKPMEAQDHAARLQAVGAYHLDAPVSGGTVGAEAGTLAIMVGGEANVFAEVEDVLRVMGRPVHVGPHGAGQLAKLANQIIVGVTIGAVAEALMLVEKGGADPAKVREALSGGFAESRILELHGQRMVDRDFTTKGRSKMQLKDLDNAVEAAQILGMSETPFSTVTAELFRTLIETNGDLDHSGLLVELESRNGISIPFVGCG